MSFSTHERKNSFCLRIWSFLKYFMSLRLFFYNFVFVLTPKSVKSSWSQPPLLSTLRLRSDRLHPSFLMKIQRFFIAHCFAYFFLSISDTQTNEDIKIILNLSLSIALYQIKENKTRIIALGYFFEDIWLKLLYIGAFIQAADGKYSQYSLQFVYEHFLMPNQRK